VRYDVHPFTYYRLPEKSVRDLDLSWEEFNKLRNAEFKTWTRANNTARDMFMLSFYLGGINLTDLLSAELDGDVLTFVRKKTSRSKHGEKRISLTIQPEAREIIDRYAVDGHIRLGYNFGKYELLRGMITHALNRIGRELGFEKQLCYYSARKTFCQFGHGLGIPLYILEYSIGQSIKEEKKRPIFNYIRLMREEADDAIRRIIDYTKKKPRKKRIKI
jgi:hypothetical protein